MQDDVVTLRVFNSHIEADLARSALEAAGIESIVGADDSGGMRPHLALTAGVRLLVRAGDAERAEQVLDTPARRTKSQSR
jgi:Putative prokaryotic signal transducing protein